MGSVTQLLRSLTADGRFDRRDAAQLLDEVARDGVRDPDEERELKDIARALQTDSLSIEPGAGRQFERFVGMRDGERFVRARQALTDGQLDARELEAVLAGPASRDQVEDARALLEAGDLTPEARRRVLERLPNARRPWERPELALRGPDPYPGMLRGETDSGEAELSVPMEGGKALTLRREFGADGRVTRVTVDVDGDGVVDHTHEYRYDDRGQLVGSRSFRGADAASADLLVETLITLDAAGRVDSEARVVSSGGETRRELARHVRDPLTGEETVELSGDDRVFEHGATLFPAAPSEPGRVVAERVKLSAEGVPRSHVVELDSASSFSRDAGWHSDVRPPARVLNQDMLRVPMGVETRDAQGRVSSRSSSAERAEFEYDAAGHLVRQRYFEVKNGEARLVTSWEMEHDARGRVVAERRETQREPGSPIERSRASHVYLDDGREQVMVESATGGRREFERAAHGGVTGERLLRADGSIEAEMTATFDAGGRLVRRDEVQRDERGGEIDRLHEQQEWGQAGVVRRETSRSSTGLEVSERFLDTPLEAVVERETRERTAPRLSRFDRPADAGDFGADARPTVAETRRSERFSWNENGELVSSSCRWEERYVRGEA